jgi:DNA phosphorothioation-dependent restriction protein DptF
VKILIYTYLESNCFELAEVGKKVDEQLFDAPQNAIISARLYCELLVKKVIEIEAVNSEAMSSQLDRINILVSQGLIEEPIITALNYIRIAGNKAVHQGESEDLETAIRVHKKIYEITKWFIEAYGDNPTIIVPPYKSPKPKTPILSIEVIELAIKNQFNELFKKEKAEINDSVQVSKMRDSNQSHLFNELLKLKESSAFAVENINEFSDYKKYMHIDRPIQERLKNILIESNIQNGATLVLLCGSVGDGKSHLLSYFKEHEKALLSRFSIHNDATESFSPEKTSIETLREELRDFSDSRIKDSNTKMVLAINLGVLHNFIESEMSDEFKMLKKYIDEVGIFKSNGIKQSSIEHFKMINFTDFNLFELSKDGIDSHYITQLMQKLTVEDESNPFHKAYRKDIEKGIRGIHIENYRLLKNLKVQNKIKRILSFAIFEEKEMISTRALLNFFFDLLAPLGEEEMKDIDLNQPKSLYYLLPNNLFESRNKSILLNKVRKFDPLKYRNGLLDDALMDFHNSDYLEDVFKKHIIMDNEYTWINTLKVKRESLESEDERISVATLFRTAYLIGKKDWYEKEEKAFDYYTKAVFGYHTKCFTTLENLDNLFRTAYFKWNGSPKESFIFSEVNGNKVKTAYDVDIEFDLNQYNPQSEGEKSIENYKMSITLPYKNVKNANTIEIEIDLALFKLLIKVSNGYIPNSKDRENALVMEDFVRETLNSLAAEDKLLFEVNNLQRYLLTAEKKITGTKYIFRRA